MLCFGGLAGLFVLLLSIAAGGPVSAGEDRPVLRLLILRPDTEPVAAGQAAGVDDSAVPAMATEHGREIARGFIGRPIDDTLLAEIRDKLLGYYEDLGRPFVDVAIPLQDVSAGTLRVNIVETKRGRLTVEGNRWFADTQYLDAVQTPEGGPIDISSLTADTAWLNRNQQRHVAMSLRPTDDPAVYDVAILAKDSLPLTLTLAADNTGTTETGLYRTGIGIDWTNAFWRGDDLDFGFVTDPGGFRLKQYAATYTAYLPWRDSIGLTAIAADTIATSTGFAVNGHTDILSWRYNLSLPSSETFNQHMEFGYDFKSTNTNILSGGAAVFPATSELDQFSASYATRFSDSRGVTGLTALLVGSPGGLTQGNTQSELADQQPGASPTYIYGRLAIERLTNLAYGNAWNIRLTGQYSSDNLLPSEQLPFGGFQSVRGFMDLGATRDSGLLMQNEWRLAPIETALFPALADTQPLVPFLFLDMGAGRNHLDLAGQPKSWVEMVSVGPGVNWQLSATAAFRFTWGVPLVRNGHPGPLLGPQFGTQVAF